jgi:hypothetical protein
MRNILICAVLVLAMLANSTAHAGENTFSVKRISSVELVRLWRMDEMGMLVHNLEDIKDSTRMAVFTLGPIFKSNYEESSKVPVGIIMVADNNAWATPEGFEVYAHKFSSVSTIKTGPPRGLRTPEDSRSDVLFTIQLKVDACKNCEAGLVMILRDENSGFYLETENVSVLEE